MGNARSIRVFVSVVMLSLTGLAQKARYVAQDNGTFIKVMPYKMSDNSGTVVNTTSMFGLSFSSTNSNDVEKVDTIFVALDSGYYKSNTEDMLFLLDKEGYRLQTQLVSLEKVRANKKRFVFNRLEKLPIRKSKDTYILVEQVDFNIRRKQYIQKFYDNLTDFERRNAERVTYSEKDITIDNTIFEDRLNNYLVKTQHIDTTQKLNLNIFDRIKLKITVTGITEHNYNGFQQLELRSTVKFETFFGNKREVEKEYTTLGNVGFNYQNNTKNMISSALESIFTRLVEDPELSRNFKNQETELKKLTDSLPEILITNKNTSPFNLENATNAVVTIVEPTGHGSGCIVSGNGYIITNFHVVGQDTQNVFAIFNSGAKKRCRFIRGNPLNDLTLLQVDTTIAFPLNINLSKTISVGADVYAIGTPRDISLGQSITKGIISAKRNIENKIYIQSDVSVNSGNSGGAMTNKDGELIGIVNAKLVGYGVEGVSFAIPAYYIEEFLRVKFVK